MALTNEDKQWITELLETRLERLETKLLTEFHKYAEFNDQRARGQSHTVHSLELQVEALRDRVERLERSGRP